MRRAIANAYADHLAGGAKPPEPPTMTTFAAAMIADGEWDMAGFEPSEENYFAAYQHLIDSGSAWTLQGRIGRQAAALIDAGHCAPANH